MLVSTKATDNLRTSFCCSLGACSGVIAALVSAFVCVILFTPVSRAELPKRITVAHSASWTPYAFRNAEGEPEGLLIDFWRLFGEKNGVEVAFKLVDWQDS